MPKKESRTFEVLLRMDSDLVERIDEARGLIPRSVFMRELLRNALKSGIRVE